LNLFCRYSDHYRFNIANHQFSISVVRTVLCRYGLPGHVVGSVISAGWMLTKCCGGCLAVLVASPVMR